MVSHLLLISELYTSMPRNPSLVLALLAFMSIGNFAHAGSIDWSAQSWTPGSLTHPAFNTGDNSVTLSFSDPDGAMQSGSPSIQTGLASGYDGQLRMGMEGHSENDRIILTINFANPVTSLTFAFTDIDTGGGTSQNWVDELRVSSNRYGSAVNVTGTAENGNPSFDINNSYGSGGLQTRIVADAGDIPSTSTRGNVRFTFSGELTQVVIEYRANPNGPGSPSAQFIRLTDISFAVPEPSTWAMMLVALACGGYAVRLRRRAALSPS